MKDEDLIEKLWRLQCLMAEIESKAGEVAKHLGFKGMHQTVYDYIKNTEYDIKMYQPQVEGTQWLGFFEVKKQD